MEQYAILAPKAGIKTDAPSMLLHDAFSPQSMNTWVHNERVDRATMRLKEFSAQLPDDPVGIHYYQRKSLVNFLMIMTKRDICFRDDSNDRFVYITPQYTTGTGSFVNGDATVTFAGGADTAAMKVGDFIKTGSVVATSDDTWYEIESITDGTHVELTIPYVEANTGAAAYILRDTFNGDDNDLWSFTVAYYDNMWIATNNAVDYSIYWNGVTTTVSTLTELFKAAYVTYFEGYVVFGKLGNYPQRIQWSDLNNYNVYDTGDAGTADIEGADPLSGFSKWQDFMVVFKEQSIHLMWLVETADIFNRDLRVSGIGCYAGQSIIRHENKVYFWSNDNKFRAFNGLHANEEISKNIDDITTIITPNYEVGIYGLYSEELKQLWWAVPSGPGSTYNDKVLTYDLETQSWGVLDLEVVCFGTYITETDVTWDTLPWATWDEWAGRWDDRTFTAGAPIDLIGNRDNYIYRAHAAEQDNLIDFTGYFELNQNFFEKPNMRKRLLRYRVYFQKEGGATISLQIRVDDKILLETALSKNLDDQVARDVQEIEVVCDYSGKSFGLYGSASNPFKFLGIIYEYEDVGVR